MIIMIIMIITMIIIIMTRLIYTHVINTYKYIARTVYISFNSMSIAEPSIVFNEAISLINLGSAFGNLGDPSKQRDLVEEALATGSGWVFHGGYFWGWVFHGIFWWFLLMSGRVSELFLSKWPFVNEITLYIPDAYPWLRTWGSSPKK